MRNKSKRHEWDVSVGVKVIIATTACGSLQEDVKPGDLVLPDSVFDRYVEE